MSSQFTPQGVNNGVWTSSKILKPEYFNHVMIQWYEGNCNTQNGFWTCPKWGNSNIVNDSCKTVTWDKNIFDYTNTCGMVDWLNAFSNEQNPNSSQWTTDKIVIGSKSWCTAQCNSSDSGIWNAEQIKNITKGLNGNIGGVGLWNINDYYNDSYNYTNQGNPISSECSFTEQVAFDFGNTTVKPSSKTCDFNISG